MKFLNQIIAAVLLTFVVIFIINKSSDVIYKVEAPKAVLKVEKKISSINLNIFDVIVTVCEHARETRPVVLHKKIVDPATIRGPEDETSYV